MSGEVTIGDTVHIACASQGREFHNEENRIFEEIAEDDEFVRVGERKMAIRQYVAQFNFPKRVQDKIVGDLSGGERNRVHLAKLLKRGCNVLMFDEV